MITRAACSRSRSARARQIAPVLERARRVVADAPAHRDQIAARDAAIGIGQPVRELRVVGEQQQAARRGVEPADRDESGARVAQHVEDRAASLRVAPRRDRAARLVKRDRAPGRSTDRERRRSSAGRLRERRAWPGSSPRARRRGRGRPESSRAPRCATRRRAWTTRARATLRACPPKTASRVSSDDERRERRVPVGVAHRDFVRPARQPPAHRLIRCRDADRRAVDEPLARGRARRRARGTSASETPAATSSQSNTPRRRAARRSRSRGPSSRLRTRAATCVAIASGAGSTLARRQSPDRARPRPEDLRPDGDGAARRRVVPRARVRATAPAGTHSLTRVGHASVGRHAGLGAELDAADVRRSARRSACGRRSAARRARARPRRASRRERSAPRRSRPTSRAAAMRSKLPTHTPTVTSRV